MSIFIATLSTIVKSWNQPKCLLTDDWIKTLWNTYSMEYCPTFKKDEVVSFGDKMYVP